MYDKKDPRAALMAQDGEKPTSFADSKYVKFYEHSPEVSAKGTETWWARAQNFFLAYSNAASGDVFERKEQVDEYVLLLPDENSEATVHWDNQSVQVEGFSLAIIPSGKSTVVVNKGGVVIRLFSVRNEDLAELPLNKLSYEERDPNVPEFQPWPESPHGKAVRVYSLNVPKEEGRFGRIFRCSTFMINVLDEQVGPRDPSKLSPHSHNSFEQGSLVLEGEYIHHLRRPWMPDKSKWRPDEHERVGSPSLTVMPTGVIHTSEAVGTGVNKLVDIFSPPRVDFSQQEGWVLNEDDYPVDK